ncbi:hypothetical protein [Porphyromonas levii]|uniref:hypothetical protein n=1 Tax=Porphyromonas levii TaxID=28114 RepID=UPI001B8B3A8F|nr:hypothetical protein [Porphyromonas levii]MBR8713336.1 hypothetical protein [Porphyromonas levii]MBR8715341.1 hypothetical protein [Porphyromonas levii]MBR8727867.1 hypothetical protein [Porphyromonas levii]MBR8730344.1 hypothetical protein [Porphyromonas levii]MBR8736206.1 hypothetical protein [Porphyromonas levii]
MNGFLRIVYIIAILLAIQACGGSSAQEAFDVALREGRLADAELSINKLKDKDGFYSSCSRLIDEYLAIDNVDRAIFVFDEISPHCSMYEVKLNRSTSDYTCRNAKKIYQQLIVLGRYDEAWSYHPLSYKTESYPGNAPDYFAFMVDVVTYLCDNGRLDEALSFINSHIHWFTKNVDNSEWGKNYPEYQVDIMRSELLNVINSF